MYIVIVILILIVCVALIFLVSIQNSKGGGLASNLQGANVASQLMGVRRAADVVEKLTWTALGVIVLLTFLANIVISGGDGGGESKDLGIKTALETQPMTLPSAPAPSAPQPAANPAPQPAPAE